MSTMTHLKVSQQLFVIAVIIKHLKVAAYSEITILNFYVFCLNSIYIHFLKGFIVHLLLI